MSRVSITRSLLDDLAMSISAKSGEPVPMTLDEMKDAVDGIQTGGTLITKSITANDTYYAEDDNADGYSSVTVNVPTPASTLETVTKTYTPTETAQTETITPSTGFDGIEEVDVTVGAISNTYVGSGITRKSAQTYVPSASVQTISANQYLTGDQTINPITLTKYAIRPDATLVQSYTYDKYLHEDESITIPGYSTSAQTIKASSSIGTITLDRDNYQYYIVERMLTIPSYSVTTHNKGRCEYHIGVHAYEVMDLPGSSLHSLIEPTRYYTSRLNAISTTMAQYREVYYSATSTLSTYSTQAYGICQAAAAPSVSSGTLTINSPTVTMRGSTTYFVNTYANAVTDIRAQYVIEVYKAPKNNLNYDGWSTDQLFKQVVDAVNSNTQKLT